MWCFKAGLSKDLFESSGPRMLKKHKTPVTKEQNTKWVYLFFKKAIKVFYSRLKPACATLIVVHASNGLLAEWMPRGYQRIRRGWTLPKVAWKVEWYCLQELHKSRFRLSVSPIFLEYVHKVKCSHHANASENVPIYLTCSNTVRLDKAFFRYQLGFSLKNEST